tara:strand:- start:1759 stop:2466 length:708 start_codon:yes stop_codon:yes gene_type:complete
MITDSFKNDFEFILNKVKRRDSFSFSKYADGEYKILRNEKITNCDNWTFSPDIHQTEQHYLKESFQYSHEDYFVGVSCPCCQPPDHVNWMRENVGSDNITWANLFVNSNYPTFVYEMLQEFSTWEGRKVLLANEVGKEKMMPIPIDVYVPCNGQAFLMPDLSEHIKEMTVLAEQEDKQLFLFSAGPLGNILAHKLHEVNPNNTYMDIGSTMNPWIVGTNRGYLQRPHHLLNTCTW